MSIRVAAIWALGALAGLAAAAVLALAASNVVGQHIGLGGEPLSAGKQLAPPIEGGPAPATAPPTGDSRTTSLPQRTRPSGEPPVGVGPAPRPGVDPREGWAGDQDGHRDGDD